MLSALRSSADQYARNELIALEAEQHNLHARLNAWLACPKQRRYIQIPIAQTAGSVALGTSCSALNNVIRTCNLQLFRCRIESIKREISRPDRTQTSLTLPLGGPIQHPSAIGAEWELMFRNRNIPLQQSSLRRSAGRERYRRLRRQYQCHARSRKEATTNQVSAEPAEALCGIGSRPSPGKPAGQQPAAVMN